MCYYSVTPFPTSVAVLIILPVPVQIPLSVQLQVTLSKLVQAQFSAMAQVPLSVPLQILFSKLVQVPLLMPLQIPLSVLVEIPLSEFFRLWILLLGVCLDYMIIQLAFKFSFPLLWIFNFDSRWKLSHLWTIHRTHNLFN